MAQKIAKKLEGTDLVMPFKRVPVDVLEELVKMGVPVSTANVGSVSAEDKADFMRRKAEWEKKYPGARFTDLKMTKDEYAKWGKDAKKAVKVLYANQGGDVIAALHHPNVGDIDLVWGYEGTGKSDGYGLSKLVKYHPEVVEDLQGMLDSMRVKKAGKNRIRLENDTHESAISLDWYGERKTWLLTAYRKREEAGTKTMNTGTNQKDDLQSDTALPQTSFLGSKDSNKLLMRKKMLIKMLIL